MSNRNIKRAAAALCLSAYFAASSIHAAGQSTEPGVLLREGTWDSGVGSFLIPQAFEKLKPSAWPTDGWIRLVIHADRIERQLVSQPKRQVPGFLQSILAQMEPAAESISSGAPSSETESAALTNYLYLRVPNVRITSGTSMAYRFNNGTSGLKPILDHRYELQLGQKAFAFTVRNGLRNSQGVAYGEGAHYTIEYDGHKYEYDLGGFGWDSNVVAIADIDGDGKPDFVISGSGSNSGYDAVILSSIAKPGKNSPSASLGWLGC